MPWSNDRDARKRSNAIYGPAWRRKRKAQLERDAYVCQIRTPGICTYRATQVDHITSADADPDHNHLRSVCEPCHRHRTATEQGGGFRRARQQTDPEPRSRTRW